MVYENDNNSPRDYKLVNQKSDNEDLQHKIESRFEDLLEKIQIQNKVNENIHEEQRNTIESLQKEIQRQNELYTNLMTVTEDLQQKVGIPKDSPQFEANEEDIEVPITFSMMAGNSTNDTMSDDVKPIENYVVYDVPTFFCCVSRLLYLITALVATFDVETSFQVHQIVFAAMALFFSTLSTAFEYCTDIILPKINRIFYYALAIGGIAFWTNFLIHGTKFSSSNREIHAMAYSLFYTGGVVVCIEIILIIQLVRKQIQKMLISSHTCGVLGTIFLVISLEFRDEKFAIVYMIMISFQTILIYAGLPVIQHEGKKQDQKISNDPKTFTENNEIQYTHETSNDMNVHFSERENINQPLQDDMNIVDRLNLYERRLRSLESKQGKQNEENEDINSSLHFYPKGLSKSWTKRAELSNDTYTMMMLSHWTETSFPHPLNFLKKNSCTIVVPRPSKPWVLGLLVFVTQTALASFTLADQLKTGYGDTVLDIPIYVTPVVRVGQFFTLVLSFMSQTDLLVSFRVLLFLSYRRNTWLEVIGEEDKKKDYSRWVGRIFLPNLLKSIQGFVVLATTYVLILQSDDIVDLLKDFTALFIISSIDDMFFFLAEFGYLGFSLRSKTQITKEQAIEEDDPSNAVYLQLYFIITIILMFGGWILVACLQAYGLFVRQEYPLCPRSFDDSKIGDGICDFSKENGTNILDCGWDGGDCLTINEELPECKVDKPSSLDNGICNGGAYNTLACGYDGGDCNYFNENYSNCETDDPSLIRNGVCNIEYNVLECGYDGGDCQN